VQPSDQNTQAKMNMPQDDQPDPADSMPGVQLSQTCDGVAVRFPFILRFELISSHDVSISSTMFAVDRHWTSKTQQLVKQLPSWPASNFVVAALDHQVRQTFNLPRQVVAVPR
jgi:hypothetical protein